MKPWISQHLGRQRKGPKKLSACISSLGLLLCLSSALAVHAQEANYPSKAIRLVVGFSPGGSADGVGRALAENLSLKLGQPVIVENRAGANGNIGVGQVVNAAPDGYMLGTASAAMLST